ncbi:MAG: hypothetical protein ABIR78_11870 [Ferruginibacter sp.]
MKNENKNTGRRKFIAWGVASAALFTAVKFILPSKKKPETVKMLTQDGKLVEVAIASLPQKKKKITNGELQNWINK